MHGNLPIYRLLFILGIAFYSVSGRGQALAQGDGLELVVRDCTQCHSLSRITGVQLTAEEWENALYDMIARGAPVHEDDLATIRRYLIENYATNEE